MKLRSQTDSSLISNIAYYDQKIVTQKKNLMQ